MEIITLVLLALVGASLWRRLAVLRSWSAAPSPRREARGFTRRHCGGGQLVHQSAGAVGSAPARGAAGEAAVAAELLKLPDEYVVFNNVVIPAPGGRTTQIDHLIISAYGLFVIETKNFGGAIYGRPHALKWHAYYAGQRHQFFNPLRQNSWHQRCLFDLLHRDSPALAFVSLVAFSRRARLKVGPHDSLCRFDEVSGRIVGNRYPLFGYAVVAKLAARVSQYAESVRMTRPYPTAEAAEAVPRIVSYWSATGRPRFVSLTGRPAC
jgi:hypothetical protein